MRGADLGALRVVLTRTFVRFLLIYCWGFIYFRGLKNSCQFQQNLI